MSLQPDPSAEIMNRRIRGERQLAGPIAAGGRGQPSRRGRDAQREIAEWLGIGQSTVSDDLQEFRQRQARAGGADGSAGRSDTVAVEPHMNDLLRAAISGKHLRYPRRSARQPSLRRHMWLLAVDYVDGARRGLRDQPRAAVLAPLGRRAATDLRPQSSAARPPCRRSWRQGVSPQHPAPHHRVPGPDRPRSGQANGPLADRTRRSRKAAGVLSVG
jgi:hypothetical protein